MHDGNALNSFGSNRLRTTFIATEAWGLATPLVADHSRALWKGGGLQRVQVPPGNWFAPPGSNRSSGGGNEAVEAFDVKGRYGDSASVQAVT